MDSNKIVYGAAKLSNLGEKKAYEILAKLYEFGIREVDTAPSYGESEKYLGKLFRDFPDLLINSKVGCDVDGKFSPLTIQESVYKSLENLEHTRINTLFIHSVPHQRLTPQVLNKISELKQEGLCRTVGYSGDGDNLSTITLNNSEIFDALMFTYNFLDQSNYQIINKGNLKTQLYVKRVLANGVWRKRTLKDLAKELLKRSRGHEEYRLRMKALHAGSLKNGFTSSIDFVQNDFPDAKFLIGVTSIRQCDDLTSYLTAAKHPNAEQILKLKKAYADASEKHNWDPVT